MGYSKDNLQQPREAEPHLWESQGDTGKDPEKEALNEKEEEDDNQGVPTDSGFAWVITFSVFTMMMVIIGFNRSLSVLFVDISEEFQQKATIVSLMFTLHSLSGSVSSIVTSNIIMSRVTIRKICVVSSIANSLISVCMSLAPNIVLFLLLFVLKGVFFGALLVAPMSLIGFYFKKRRSLASSIATAGMCVAFIVFPPITEVLRVEFGMRGSFLVLAAIELHTLACSLLLRSKESYTKRHNIRQRRKELAKELLGLMSPIYKGDKPAEDSTSINHLPSTHTDIITSEAEHSLLLANGTDSSVTQYLPPRHRSPSDASSGHSSHPGEDSFFQDLPFTPSSSPGQFSSLKDLDMPLTNSREDLNRSRQARRRSVVLERQASHLSAMSLAELPYLPLALDEEGAGSSAMAHRRQNLCSRLLNIFIDVSVFKIWRFRMMAVFVPLSVFANYTIIYMPVICSTLRIHKSDAALLMTISGIMDLVTRIITGFIGDFKFMSIPKLVAFSTIVVGTVCHIIRFFTTHTLFIVYAILVGVFGGVRQNFFSLMLMEYVGVDRMAKAYGLASTLATLSLSINHPVVAALFDVTQGFNIPLHYVGTMVYLGTLVLLFEPIFLRLDQKNALAVSEDKKSPNTKLSSKAGH